MRRWSIPLLLLIFCGAFASAQAASENGHLFSSDLIAWTSMQSPQAPEQQPGHKQPTPEPSPETQPAQNPTPSQQPSSPDANQAQNSAQEHTPQAFVGTIAKQADSFVLQASASTFYKLDNESQVQQYVGQRVRVIGRLDQSLNLIHVDRIEPIS